MPSLLLFAAAREAAGCRRVDIPSAPLSEVLAWTEQRFGPDFARVLRFSNVLVDGEKPQTDVHVKDGSEVAILPPVSGG